MTTAQLAAAISADNLESLMPEIEALPVSHQCHIMHHLVMREIHPLTQSAASTLEEANIIAAWCKNHPAYTDWCLKNNKAMHDMGSTDFSIPPA